MPRELPSIIQPPPTTPASSSSVASEASFRDLPLDLFGPNGELSHYLRPSDFRHLIAADPRFFQPLLSDEGFKLKLRQFHKLLVHITNANLAETEAMIKEDPGLLIDEGQVMDREHLYKGTALTIALELGDISIYPEKNEEMADMIIRHLKTLPNGEAEIARQIQTYFPKGFVKVTPYDFTEICKAIQNSADADVQAALRNEQNDIPLCKALNKFREEFSKCSRNLCHFVAAVALYDTEFDNFKNLDQRNLFCIQIIGFVQRYLPLCDIYPIKQGIFNIVGNKRQLIRDGFELNDWVTPGSNGTQKIKVFSWGGIHSGLGVDYLVEGELDLGYAGVAGRLAVVGWEAWGALCKKLMSDKNRALGELYTSISATQPSLQKIYVSTGR